MPVESIILSDESVNRHGYRIITSGIDLSGFLKNPVMLLDHGRMYPLSIGKWKNVRVEGTRLLADPEFQDSDPWGKLIKQKYEEGYMTAASVHVNRVVTSEDSGLLVPGQTRATVIKSHLIEASAATISVNQNAVELSLQQGETLDDKIPLLSLMGEKNHNMDLKNIGLALGLTQGATEEEVLAAIKKSREMQVEILLSVGVDRGLINEGNKEHFRKLALADFTSTQQLILSFEKPAEAPAKEKKEEAPAGSPSIADLLKLAAGGDAPKGEKDRKDWTYDDYQTKDPNGLLAMKRDQPERYSALALAYEGKTWA